MQSPVKVLFVLCELGKPSGGLICSLHWDLEANLGKPVPTTGTEIL